MSATSPSIDTFVTNRWSDAKEVLRRLDSPYVQRMESTHRMQTAGLVVPNTWGESRTPTQRLPAGWHRLLEACFELSTQSTFLKVSVKSLSASSLAEFSMEEAGVQAMFHLRSWYIHATSLTETCEDAINSTVDLYVEETSRVKQLKRDYKGRVYQRAKQPIESQRNGYVHLAKRPWGKVATERNIWEGAVSIDMVPQSLLEDSFWLFEGQRGKDGFFEPIIDLLTSHLYMTLGEILGELESEIR